MKRLLAAVLLMVLLCGCNGASDPTQLGMELRQKLLTSDGCHFVAVVRADFGEAEYDFALDCRANKEGTLYFTVNAPETISGIDGYVDAQSGKITFDKTVLTFPLLAEGVIPPLCAPWLFYKALIGGYIRASGTDEDGARITIDDSFQGENLTLELWLKEGQPIWAELVWQGRKLLTLHIQQFEIM